MADDRIPLMKPFTLGFHMSKGFIIIIVIIKGFMVLKGLIYTVPNPSLTDPQLGQVAQTRPGCPTRAGCPLP